MDIWGEGKKEGKKNMEAKEAHRLVASHACTNQVCALPWLGIEPMALWCVSWLSNWWPTPARARAWSFCCPLLLKSIEVLKYVYSLASFSCLIINYIKIVYFLSNLILLFCISQNFCSINGIFFLVFALFIRAFQCRVIRFILFCPSWYSERLFR